MASFNKVFILGNLTRDVEMRYMPSGSPVANFGIATNRKWTGNDGEKKEEVTFVDISCFGKTAELCSQYLSKGRQVLIEGRLKFEQWDAKDGSGKRSKLKVVAERVTFLGGNGGQRSENTRTPADNDRDKRGGQGGGFAPDDDDVPF